MTGERRTATKRYALNAMAPGSAAGENGGFRGFHGDDAAVRQQALEVEARARQGRAGADPGHERVDHAVIVVKDFRAGGGVVGLYGVGVGKLAGLEGLAFLGDAFGLRHGGGHAAFRGGKGQFRAQGGQQAPALHAHGFRHGQHAAQAAHGADEGQTYAHVAAGRLDDRAARGQFPALHGAIQNIEGGPILDGAARILIFEFQQQDARQSGGKTGKTQQRRASDALE